MVAGVSVDVALLSPVPVAVELVKVFQSLGSCIGWDVELVGELAGCLVKAAKMFGCFQKPIVAE